MEFTKLTNTNYHLTASFDCKNTVINNFLKSEKALDSNQGVTYILLNNSKDKIIGFYNIGISRIDQVQSIGDTTYATYMGGTAVLNYLALNEPFQYTYMLPEDSYSYGDYLLDNCESKLLSLRNKIGFSFITISSTKEGLHLYRDKHDYEEFEEAMSIVVQESDKQCIKLYKWADDLEIE